jgi:hypothetical protein
MFGEPIKYIYFENKTDLPVQIGSWVDGSNTMKMVRIGPGEKWMLHSSVGEWHMDSMFEDSTDRDLWAVAGLKHHHIIGKFRSEPCASGDYSWLEYRGPFECTYNKLCEDVRGLITLTKLST